MGAKTKTNIFYCKECGYESAKWLGQCPGCREWNTFVEEPAVKKGNSMVRTAASASEPYVLSKISLET
ncbi:MAG: DNA repair protein RadA, partial [Lachnospiraceae bacterium]|nr:DNA repair protein RadA [Lachnospiraceae bacterium]